MRSSSPGFTGLGANLRGFAGSLASPGAPISGARQRECAMRAPAPAAGEKRRVLVDGQAAQDLGLALVELVGADPAGIELLVDHA